MLGQVKVVDKSNEIVVIPRLLDMLAIEVAVVTIDAMGASARSPPRSSTKANDVLALKGNEGTLCEDVELFAKEQKSKDFNDTTISQNMSVDGDHGRIETRRTTRLS